MIVAKFKICTVNKEAEKRMKKTLCIFLSIVSLMMCGCAVSGQAHIDSGNQKLSEVKQWELLSEAYRYVFPLMMMNQTMKTATNGIRYNRLILKAA